MRIENPLVMMFNTPDGVICHVHPGEFTHEHYGILVCDLVRHVANAFKVNESDVWHWVDAERNRPTSSATQVN
jgi:hypothetical protein